MKLKERLKKIKKYKIIGKVIGVVGPLIEAILPEVSIGDACYIEDIEAEVIGFKDGKTLLMAYTDTKGIKVGSKIIAKNSYPKVKVGKCILGKVLDAFGKPIDNTNIVCEDEINIHLEPINPLERERITQVFDTGIKAINGLLTIGKGQRIGILAGAGVGKSSLLGMIAKFSNADINVIALVGERGREVREFIEDNLGEEGLKKSVVVVSTSDQPPLAKIRASILANAIAKYFADKGKDVLLMFDSLTRLAMAQREVGLTVGEPPTTKGYTPSVFSLLPKIIEISGNFKKGSITGIYTVLVEGDDISVDPVADSAIGFLDGHIVLSRDFANKRIFLAVDILKSISRLTPQLVNERILNMQKVVLELESAYREAEDIINLGIYKKGSNPKIDLALDIHNEIINFIKQGLNEKVNFAESLKQLEELFNVIQSEGLRYGIRY